MNLLLQYFGRRGPRVEEHKHPFKIVIYARQVQIFQEKKDSTTVTVLATLNETLAKAFFKN